LQVAVKGGRVVRECACEQISDADINEPLHGADICEFGLEERLKQLIVVKAGLDSETLGDAADPVLIKTAVCCVLPKCDHSLGCCGFLTNRERAKNRGVHTST
jgi:hypothetical protein